MKFTRTAPRTGATASGRGILTASLAGLALLLAACGSDSSNADTSTKAPTQGTDPVSLAAGSATGTPTADTAAPVAGGTLTFAVANDPISLNPSSTGSGNDTLYVTRQLFDSLTEQDPATGDVIPWLAKSFKASDDAKSFEFTLRPGVTFSDGTPLTAASVKATFDDINTAGAKAASAIVALAGYTETEVTGDLTFTVKFSEPNGSFLQATSAIALAPVAASTLAIPYDDRASGVGVVGTGPFTLDHYTKNNEVVLKKRTGYNWGPADRTNTGEAHLDQVVFKIVPESGVRTGSLESGQVQVIGGVAPQDISGLKDSGFGLVVRPNPGLTFGLTANVSRPIVGDLAVRQAIAHAVNATDVRDTALNEYFKVATSSLAANTPGWADQSALISFDPEKSKALLDAAGWVPGPDGIRAKDGVPLHLLTAYISNFGPNQTALELVQQELKDVGIDVELWTGTVPDLLAGQQEGKFDLIWGNSSRADGDVLRTTFSSVASNYYKIDDKELDAALIGQQSTADPAKRNAFLATAQKILVEKAYQVPVHELTTVLGTAKNVHGVVLGADSRLSQLTDASIG